jgi:hypothetical protein
VGSSNGTTPARMAEAGETVKLPQPEGSREMIKGNASRYVWKPLGRLHTNLIHWNMQCDQPGHWSNGEGK